MTKADLVGQVADAIGPGVTMGECRLVIDGFLGAVRERSPEAMALRSGVSARSRSDTAKPARPATPGPENRVEVPARAVAAFKPSRHLNNQVARRHSPTVAERPAGGPVEAS